jgi:hypothetical protein
VTGAERFAELSDGLAEGVRRRDGLIALTAREGDIGFAVVYDDGHVFEFPTRAADAVAARLDW